MESDTKSYFQIVSDLSRDMDGFLYLKPEPKLEHKPERFRPLARYGWGPTNPIMAKKPFNQLFPSPLEVWVGSYKCLIKFQKLLKMQFPSPLKVWVGSYKYSRN